MKKLLLTGAALCAFGAMPAMAADLPIAPAPVEPMFVPAPVFTWDGFYVGVNAGYAWGDFEVRDAVLNTAPGGFFLPAQITTGDTVFVSNLDFDGDGFIGGAQIGYNAQFDQFVFGVEADIQYSDVEETLLIGGAPGGPAAGLTTRVSTELDYIGTVRARAGFALDRFMVYATGGLAYGRVEIERGYFNAADVFINDSDRNVHVGYTVGAGVEGAITDNLSAKLEYLYVDLGKETYDHAYFDGTTATLEAKYDAHIVRAGLNYRFSW